MYSMFNLQCHELAREHPANMSALDKR